MSKKKKDYYHIKAEKVKPGMIIGIDRNDDYGDISLVTRIDEKGHDDFSCWHYSIDMTQMGVMIGRIKFETKVRVFTGETRIKYLDMIRKDICDRLHSAERDLATVTLVQSLDKQYLSDGLKRRG